MRARFWPILLILVAPGAQADVVTLKNGTEYKGIVVSDDPKAVTVQSEGAEWTIPRAKIATVTYDKATADEERARNQQRKAETEAPPPPPDPEAPHGAPVAVSIPRPPPAPSVPPRESTAQPTQASVILYSTSWCQYCQKTREFFMMRGIQYVEKNIELDPAALYEVQQKCAAAGISGIGVPIIDVYGTMVRGFDEQRLTLALQGEAQRRGLSSAR